MTNETDTIQTINLYWSLKRDLESVTKKIDEATEIVWLGAGAVAPHLQAAAQSLSVAIARLESASQRKFGEGPWSRFIPSDTQTKEDPQ